MTLGVVVLRTTLSCRATPTRPCHVVSKEWVEESAASHDDLDEREFYVLGEQFHALLPDL